MKWSRLGCVRWQRAAARCDRYLYDDSQWKEMDKYHMIDWNTTTATRCDWIVKRNLRRMEKLLAVLYK